MRNHFELENINIPQIDLNIGKVVIESDYSLQEVAGIAQIVKNAIDALPEVIDTITTAFSNGIDKAEELKKKTNGLEQDTVAVANEKIISSLMDTLKLAEDVCALKGFDISKEVAKLKQQRKAKKESASTKESIPTRKVEQF